MSRIGVFAIFAGTILGLAGLQSAQTTDGPMTKDTPSVDILPIIEIDARTDMVVQFAFENTSGREFRYQAHRPWNVADLSLELYREGRLVKPRKTFGEPPILSKDSVRVLRPGEFVLYTEKLRDRYEGLDPGLFEVRVQYNVKEGSVPHLDFGLTPLKIDRKVALLQVR
jgi:hypothetical protein